MIFEMNNSFLIVNLHNVWEKMIFYLSFSARFYCVIIETDIFDTIMPHISPGDMPSNNYQEHS